MALTPKQLDEIQNEAGKKSKNWIRVGLSTCGIAAGAQGVYQRLLEEKERHGADIEVRRTGCAGKCYAEPLVEVAVAGMPRVVYGNVDAETARDIIETHVLSKKLLNDHIIQVVPG